MSKRKIRLGIIFGGRSGEHEISLMSANSILRAVDKDKYEVVPIGITKTGKWLPPSRAQALLTGEAPSAAQDADPNAPGTALVADPRQSALVTLGGSGEAGLQALDVVFPVLHGPFGEDGTVQGFLELANIPFVGAGVLGSALGMDKVKMKEVLRYHGLPVADWLTLKRWQWRENQEQCLRDASRFGFPCFVKPANLGSSVGISKV
ncbi:MAG TPA: D-alanine--D-alanine ligase A, partial [Chloroflexota bacterium]|nr:D-alanine--D-alanine ligase A [Chloroflexota bacterium]